MDKQEINMRIREVKETRAQREASILAEKTRVEEARERQWQKKLASVGYISREGIAIEDAPFLDPDSKELLLGLVETINANGGLEASQIIMVEKKGIRRKIGSWLVPRSVSSTQVPDKSDEMWHLTIQDHIYSQRSVHDILSTSQGYSTIFADGSIRTAKRDRRYTNVFVFEDHAEPSSPEVLKDFTVPTIDKWALQEIVINSLAKLDLEMTE